MMAAVISDSSELDLLSLFTEYGFTYPFASLIISPDSKNFLLLRIDPSNRHVLVARVPLEKEKKTATTSSSSSNNIFLNLHQEFRSIIDKSVSHLRQNAMLNPPGGKTVKGKKAPSEEGVKSFSEARRELDDALKRLIEGRLTLEVLGPYQCLLLPPLEDGELAELFKKKAQVRSHSNLEKIIGIHDISFSIGPRE